MTNQELWKSYEDYSRTASDVCRQLGFAAVAIIWMLKPDDTSLSGVSVTALSLVVVFFLLDLSQYFFSTLLYGCWIRIEEKKKHKESGTIEGEYEKPTMLDIPAFALWVAKTLCLMTGYLIIARILFS